MKKLLGISLVAIMSVSAANAEIASKAYVDQQDGTLSQLTTTAKTNLVAAINEVDADVAKLNGNAQTEGSVAKKIADAIGDLGEGNDTVAEAISAVSTAAGNAVVANEAITAGTHTKITYDAKGLVTGGSDITLSDVTDVTASASEVNALHEAGAVKADFEKLHAITADAADINKLDNLATTATELGYVSGVTSAIQAQLDAKADSDDLGTLAAKSEVALTDLASGVQESLGKADTALQSSDVDQTYSATSEKAQSGKAVAEAVGAVSTTASGLDTRLTTAEGKITTAEGNITALQSAVNNESTGLAATKGIADANATAIAGMDLLEVGGNGTVIKTVSQADGQLAATASAIVNDDVASNAAIEMSKIAMPTTIANGSTEAWGTYSLTADVGANGITYKWELIER